jgi:hypothetical protein
MICGMEGSAGHAPRVARIDAAEQRRESSGGQGATRSAPPIDLALRSTEAALGHLTKVAVEEIRRGADASPHVQAAERDLRSALKQLSLAKRAS